MWKFITSPMRAYDYVHSNYGWFGIFFAALAVVLVVIAVWMWIERRK